LLNGLRFTAGAGRRHGSPAAAATSGGSAEYLPRPLRYSTDPAFSPRSCRLIARLPLDRAPDRGLVRLRRRLAHQHEIHRPAQIGPRHRLVGLRPAVIELPAIRQPPPRVVHEKIRRTRRPVRPGYLLRLIEKIGKREAMFTR